ncbi:TRAF family member-associated NF-kappa-B activator isoform X1 [Engraulis encrasicolus]|uniref:TRAF family member-associated NF-kappa-B activator isoform X1 n=1 Tax=Engraulis encrasicolus TaxID=184585 RepID=UPI002FD726A4
MEKNIADQLNKAFEAYRTASIERDNAKKELKQKTEYYERITQKLQQQIEDQNQQISILQAQLNTTTNHASGEVKCCESGLRQQETELLSPGELRHSKSFSRSYRTNHFLGNDMRDGSGPHLHNLAGASCNKTEDILEAFQEVQGKFQQIRSLTKRQKDHLRRIHRGKDHANGTPVTQPGLLTALARPRTTSSESPPQPNTYNITRNQFWAPPLPGAGTTVPFVPPSAPLNPAAPQIALFETQFSMPIQCTDVTAEQAEASFSSSSTSSAATRPSLEDSLPASPLASAATGALGAAAAAAISSLASRGANPEDADSVLSIKLPPRTDSEYEFLNSTPEKPVELPGASSSSGVHRTAFVTGVLSSSEEPSKELGVPFGYPPSLSPSSIPSVSSSMSLESVRGPQQPLWTPELCDSAVSVGSPPACSSEPHQQQNCAFCNASVPHDRMYSHLNSHFKNSACN